MGEITILQPQDFCGLGSGRICLPFVWESGVMHPGPTRPRGDIPRAYFLDVFIAEQEGKAVRRAGSQPAVT
jgi:hypothetical protein